MENSVTPSTSASDNACTHVGLIDLNSNLTKTQIINNISEIIGDTTKLGIPNQPQDILTNVYDNGGLVIAHHPHYNETGWANHTCETKAASDTVRGLNNLSGLEIFNSGVERAAYSAGKINGFKNSGLATDIWDDMLKKGKNVWGFASDDSHDAGSKGRAFIMVGSNSSNPGKTEIMNNIKAGNFYATTPLDADYNGNKDGYNKANGFPDGWPVASNNNYYDLSVTVDDATNTITASSSRGKNVRFVVDGVTQSERGNLNATYTVNSSNKYVRVEVLDDVCLKDCTTAAVWQHRAVAWSQPVKISYTPVVIPPAPSPPSITYPAPTCTLYPSRSSLDQYWINWTATNANFVGNNTGNWYPNGMPTDNVFRASLWGGSAAPLKVVLGGKNTYTLTVSNPSGSTTCSKDLWLYGSYPPAEISAGPSSFSGGSWSNGASTALLGIDNNFATLKTPQAWISGGQVTFLMYPAGVTNYEPCVNLDLNSTNDVYYEIWISDTLGTPGITGSAAATGRTKTKTKITLNQSTISSQSHPGYRYVTLTLVGTVANQTVKIDGVSVSR